MRRNLARTGPVHRHQISEGIDKSGDDERLPGVAVRGGRSQR